MTLLVAQMDASGRWQKVAKPQFTKDGSRFVRKPASLKHGSLQALWAKQAAAFFAADAAAASLDFSHGTLKVRVAKV